MFGWHLVTRGGPWPTRRPATPAGTSTKGLNGEVRWHVTLTNQDDEKVAEYELLTMNAF